jgi:thioredoxin-dependent peroxiredoxin
VSAPRVGDQAPDFELPSTDGPQKLSSYRGQAVVLVFYPGDFTPVCTKQLCSYRDSFGDLKDTGAKVLAISGDSMESHERFKKEKNLPFPLLSDEKGDVAKAYGLSGFLVKTKRCLIVIGPDGKITFRKDEPLSLTFRKADEIKEAVARAKG